MPHIRIVWAELQRLGIGVRRPRRDVRGWTAHGPSGRTGRRPSRRRRAPPRQVGTRREVAPAYRQQDRGVAQSTRAGAAAMPSFSVASAASASPVASCAAARPSRYAGLAGSLRDRLAETGDRIRRALEIDHQNPEQRLGRRIAAVEHHRFRGVRCRTVPVVHLHADFGAHLRRPACSGASAIASSSSCSATSAAPRASPAWRRVPRVAAKAVPRAATAASRGRAAPGWPLSISAAIRASQGVGLGGGSQLFHAGSF